MPIHEGHIALIRHAASRVDLLHVVLCVSASEPICGWRRHEWLSAVVENIPRAKVVLLEYDDRVYPNTSVSSVAVAEKWATLLKRQFPEANVVFSSEPYGEYLAKSMGIASECFDVERKAFPVAASRILADPERYWSSIPDVVRPYFVQTFCLTGTESTGKSTLARRLAERFQAAYVSEAGRDAVAHTDECRFEDLHTIAETHASRIFEALTCYRPLLFVDTDMHITCSYARFLFGKTLEISARVRAANRFDHYVYLAKDAPYVQDGTRLDKERRNRLDASHRWEYTLNDITPCFVTGDSWPRREQAVFRIVEELLNER